MIEQFTQELVLWIETLPPITIYLVFLVVAYGENVIPPIPGDVLVAFGGYLAAESVISIWVVYVLTTVASVVGFMTMYQLGSLWGAGIKIQKEKHWLMRFISLKNMNKVRRWMQRWGQGVVVANRFLAGTRSVISLTAGISHMPVWPTVISSMISSLLWNGLLLGFGWIVHESWYIIGDYLTIYGRIILFLLALIIIFRLLFKYYAQNDSK